MEDDNVIPYQPTPTLTVEQAVMRLLGYPGPFSFMADTEEIEFGLSDYLYNLQEEADCACGNASFELEILTRDDNASPEEIKNAEQKVASTKAKLEEANKLPYIAERYRLRINHEISRVRMGKCSPLVIDEDESARTRQLRITTTSFREWLEGMALEDARDVSAPIALPVEEDAFDRELSRKAAVSLHVTLGLLVSLFAEAGGGKFGTGQNPNVINIAKKIDDHATRLNGGQPLHGQQAQAVRKRIEVALNALHSHI